MYWITQALGRLNRNGLKEKQIKIYYDESIVDYLNYNSLSNPQVFKTKELDLLIKEFLNVKKEREYLKSRFSINTCIDIQNANLSAVSSINDFLSKKSQGSLTNTDILLWTNRRNPPKNTAFGFSKNIEAFKDFDFSQNYIFLDNDSCINKYYYTTNDNYKTVKVFKEPYDKQKYCETSLLSIRYDIAIGCDEVKDFLKNQGYIVDIDPIRDRFLVLPSPAEANNILKASLAEKVCSFILSLKNIIVDPIENTENFEDFDGLIKDKNIYIDFKNYAVAISGNTSKIRKKTEEKMIKNNASKAIFVNMYNENDGEVRYINKEKTILTISGLLKNSNDNKIVIDEKAIEDLLLEINRG